MTRAVKDHADVLVFPPLLFLFCLLGGSAMHFAVSLRITWEEPVRVAGGLVAVTAVALAGWGSWTMERAGTNIPPNKPTTTIVTSGPFAYSRNPLYLSLALFTFGLGVAVASPWLCASVIPLAAILRWGVIAREEGYLEGKFGSAYLGYKGRVRRWI